MNGSRAGVLFLLLASGAALVGRGAASAASPASPTAPGPMVPGPTTPGMATSRTTTTTTTTTVGNKGIEPQADQLLRQMSDYLARLQSFQVRSSAIDEVVTTAGQKIQIVSESQVTLERPNRLRSEQLGGDSGLTFWYDGKTMTLECRAAHSYETVPAPATIDAAIDQARKQLQIDAPGADLLYSNAYAVLTEQVKAGRFIGREPVDGLPANHLAFQGDEVDWQIWIRDGADPVPLRYVITTKTLKGAPEFSVRLSHWNTQARNPASVFEFQPQPGATRVQSLPSSCGVGTPLNPGR